MIDPTIISDDDPGYATLKNATDVTAITIDGSTYALVTAYADNGVQIIDISDPSSPKPVSSVIDGSEFYHTTESCRYYYRYNGQFSLCFGGIRR